MSEFPRDITLNYIKTDRWISGIGEEVVPLVAPANLQCDPRRDRQTHPLDTSEQARFELDVVWWI